MREELINVSNISIAFTQYTKGLQQRELQVITDLSLTISSGEIVAVLGSSGSGKSLLAHTILGILPENAILKGKMTYKGENLNQEIKEKIRGKEIALIPQSVKFLDPLMKVSEQAIGEVTNENEGKEKKAHQRRIFEKYNLDEKVDNMYPHQLSGGMARRVLISTALLSNPKLVIADEPTPGLDEQSVNETLNYFKEMAKDNVGILLITHDIDVALKIADKIAIFYSGYVIEVANSEDFAGNGEKLLHPYTKALYQALPDNDFKLTLGHQPLQGDVKEGCIYYERCPYKEYKCLKEKPELINVETKKVRCHKAEELYSKSLYSPNNEISSKNITQGLRE